GCPWDSWC
uniref:Contryphan-Fr2 n=1 Tax=Conus frigidus TaxID=101755 RepID=COW2_CONFG|nr:RecName: Full=Contryphan-Fr2; AltName: Full=Fr965 [Conus frigidus]